MALKYRADIDGLRAVAIVSVLLFHLGFQSFSGGFVGVDIFFVISGFLITGLIKKEIESTNKFNIRNFYLRRIRRLLPAFFATLILTILASILIFSPTHLSRIGGALASAVFSVSNIYFWQEADYFDISAKLKPFLHTWSLSIEEQFYIFWPLLLLFLMRTKKFWVPPFFLIIAGAMSLYLNVVFSDGEVGIISYYFPTITKWISDGQATIFFLLPFRIFEFAIGAIVVWLLHAKMSQWIYDLLFILGSGLIVYAVIVFDKTLLFPSLYGLVPTMGTALILYSGGKSRLNSLLTNIFSITIGKISYSLYLVHWPIIVFWTYVDGSLGIRAQFIIIAVSFALAFFSYKYIEQPFRNKTYDIRLPRWKYLGMIIALTLVAIGLHMKVYNGWAWRVPKTVVFEDVGDAVDYHKKFYGGAGYFGSFPKGTKEADIALIGDSHALQYAEGLYKFMVQENNVSINIPRCFSSLHLPNFVNVAQTKYIKTSKSFFKQDLFYINSVHPSLVILSESWIHQMKQSDLLDEKGSRKYVDITVKDVIEGILNLKKQIGESKLVIIGHVPGAKYNLYDIFSRPHIFSDLDPEKYIIVSSREKYTDFNKQLKDASKSSGKFVFLDPHDILCENGNCKNLDDQRHLIYSDAYHLSKYGSIVVIKGFLPVLRELIEEKNLNSNKSKKINED